MGSSNVYAYLGYADEMLIKAQLVSKIGEINEWKGLTQTQAAKLLGRLNPSPPTSCAVNSGVFRLAVDGLPYQAILAMTHGLYLRSTVVFCNL